MIRRHTWIVLGVFLVVLVVAVLWQRSNQQAAAQATATPSASLLVDLEGRQVKRFALTSREGKVLVIEKGLDGAWLIATPPGLQADEAKIEALLGDLGSLNISSQLETQLKPAIVGLDPANYNFEVEFEDGNDISVAIGDQTPVQNGYYISLEGAPPAIADTFGIDRLIEFLASPPALSTPTPITIPAQTPTGQP